MDQPASSRPRIGRPPPRFLRYDGRNDDHGRQRLWAAPRTRGPSRGRSTVLIADSCSVRRSSRPSRSSAARSSLQEDLTVETLPAAIGKIDPGRPRSSGRPRCRPRFWRPPPRLKPRSSAPGAGYDNIDVATASARGVFVANCPGRNAHRGGGADLGADPRLRSAGPPIRPSILAERDLEQEAVRQGARPLRSHARHRRARPHRSRRRGSRASAFGMNDNRVVAPSHGSRRRGDGDRVLRLRPIDVAREC